MEEQNCKTQATGLGCSNIMSTLIFSFWYGNLGLMFHRQKKRQNSTNMNQQETPSEWLARKKAGLGWLQGQHRVPGTSTNSLGGSGDKAAGNSKQQQAGDKEKVINEIISISFDKGCSSEFVKFTNIPIKIQLSYR